MKVLVIGDIHLKPWIFQKADILKQKYQADKVVCLMDIADDWRKQYVLDAYIQTYDMAIEFAKKYPDTIFCYGNHDVCYEWNMRETGYSPIAPRTVIEKLKELREALPKDNQPVFVKKIDQVLFCHGGIRDNFIYALIGSKGLPISLYDDTDELVDLINSLGPEYLWHDDSPLWFRPQYYKTKMYKEESMLQIVGHTPVEKLKQDRNIISCDVFSTSSDGLPIGTQEFLLLDTETWEWSGVKTE